MHILLAQNSPYYPSHGGGDTSNRLLMEALAACGHGCRVVARTGAFGAAEEERYAHDLEARGMRLLSRADGVVRFERCGVDVRVAVNTNLRAYFGAEIEDFRPDVILASTDDPAQLLLEAALRQKRAPIVYLVRATLAVPFGPDCAFPSQSKTERIRAASLVVGVSEYVAEYCRRYGGMDAIHVPISLMEPGPWPELGRFDNEFVTIANPCAVKGIGIFLGLADSFPDEAFAAVPTWGTTEADRAALAARRNVRLLDPVDRLDLLFARTRVLLVPSVWAEARSRIVVEAMLRGVPVMASDVGGLPEAKMGVPYLLPVTPIGRYRPSLDEEMVPVAEVPPQDIAPWREALGRLLTDRRHYEEIAGQSREAALRYAEGLSVEPFERLLGECPRAPGLRPGGQAGRPTPPELSPEKKQLLAIRLRQRAPAAAWLPEIDAVSGPRTFWFPHAGAGAAQVPKGYVGVRLPGREARLAEAPFERMGPLVEALAKAIESYTDQPFAFFGHSMGAVVAFELARALRRKGLPLPRILIASAARGPRFRRNHVPPEPSSDDELLRRLRIAPELRRAVLPALSADTTLYSHYTYTEDAPFDFPIRAYGGIDDPDIGREHLEAWGEETTGSFAVRLFPGGHFYTDFQDALEADLA
jgi:surfactin synthase thioesterase subunit/glycosyltransferase involved in cell wall biosynthesis